MPLFYFYELGHSGLLEQRLHLCPGSSGATVTKLTSVTSQPFLHVPEKQVPLALPSNSQGTFKEVTGHRARHHRILGDVSSKA